MRLDQSLPAEGQELVRDFLRFIVILSHRTNKRINTGRAMLWFRGSWYADSSPRRNK